MQYPLIDQAQPDSYTRIQSDLKFADKTYVGVTPWDITKTYQWGQHVIYKGNQYRCIGPTSGSWDPAKWEGIPAVSLGLGVWVSLGGRQFPENPMSGLVADAFDTVGHAMDWLVNNSVSSYTAIWVASGVINDSDWPIWRVGQLDIIGRASTGVNKTTLVLKHQTGGWGKDVRGVLGFQDIELDGINLPTSTGSSYIYSTEHLGLRNVKTSNFKCIVFSCTGSLGISSSNIFPSEITRIATTTRRAIQVDGNMFVNADTEIVGEVAVSFGAFSVNGTNTDLTITATTDCCMLLTDVASSDQWDGLAGKKIKLYGNSTQPAFVADNCAYFILSGCSEFWVYSNYTGGCVAFQNSDFVFVNTNGRAKLYAPGTSKFFDLYQGSQLPSDGNTAMRPWCLSSGAGDSGPIVRVDGLNKYSASTNLVP